MNKPSILVVEDDVPVRCLITTTLKTHGYKYLTAVSYTHLDEVVYPEKQLAKWAAIRYSSEHILDYIELQDDHAIMEVTIPPEC